MTAPSQPPGGPGLVRRRLLVLLALGAPGVLGACGKKGPLRLPERPAPAATPSAGSSAPGSSSESAPESSDEEAR